MGGYRAFVLGENGHICDARVFEAASDEAAVEVARRLINRHGIEIWQLARKIAILDADAVESIAATTKWDLGKKIAQRMPKLW